MKSQLLRAISLLFLALRLGHAARAQTILGTAGGYGVMAGSTVTINTDGTTGGTTITGNLGAANIAGNDPTYNLNGALVIPATPQNLTDLSKAYNGLAAMTPTTNLGASILGTAGSTVLTPGVYSFTSTAQLTGSLTLDAQGQDNAVWVFQIPTTLTTAAGSSVTFANLAANSVANDGVFWQVGGATVFGANTTFEGNLLGGTSFVLGADSTINDGRVLTGATQTITLAGNSINFDAANSGYSGGLMYDGGGNIVAVSIPEPAAFLWLAPLGVMGFALRRRSARIRSCCAVSRQSPITNSGSRASLRLAFSQSEASPTLTERLRSARSCSSAQMHRYG